MLSESVALDAFVSLLIALTSVIVRPPPESDSSELELTRITLSGPFPSNFEIAVELLSDEGALVISPISRPNALYCSINSASNLFCASAPMPTPGMMSATSKIRFVMPFAPRES